MSMAKTILNHQLVATVNLIWAIYHIWIAITIEQDNVFLAMVILFVLAFIVAYRAKENLAQNIFLVTGLLYLFPLFLGVIPTLMASDSSTLDSVGSVIWLFIIALTLLAGTSKWTGIGKT